MTSLLTNSRWIPLLLAMALTLAGPPASAQEPASAGPAAPGEEAARSFSTEQIEQIVAPIALHPDPLLTQILMASTYPLEVVQAHRLMSGTPELKGKELDARLKEYDWDASVKSLCTVPDVLKQMNENIDWMQDLGDAFLGQRVEVMDAVQRMRNRAYDSGNLKTTEQQVVTQQPDKIIVIQQSSPEVVYVPSYSPVVVYGPAWTYPAPYYPAMYVPPPYGYGLMAFGTGVAVGAALYGGASWGWGHSEVDIDVNEHNEFNRNTNANFDRESFQSERTERTGERGEHRDARGSEAGREGRGARGDGKQKWNHDPSHRKGVNYRDQKTASKFGAGGGESRVSRDQARGYERAQGRGSASAGSRDVAAPATRDGARAVSADRGAGRGRASGGGGREGAFGGSRNGGLDRSASARGDRSRGSGMSSGSSRSGSRGGMSRGAGGRGGGGRGGGGRRR